jgi:hypothetical protein
LASRRSTSRYNHTRVTSRPSAANLSVRTSGRLYDASMHPAVNTSH